MKPETITMEVRHAAALILIFSVFLGGTVAMGILMWVSAVGKVCL